MNGKDNESYVAEEQSVLDDDYEFDEIKGSHGRKPKMGLLNKKKVGSYEMDELFLEF
ncbi:hypothetical protein HYV84_05745 [Candidatus Woesearchaeota archaeon]|nr:hypothetical protein [Candidatus Woesearchaeota archaeon]